MIDTGFRGGVFTFCHGGVPDYLREEQLAKSGDTNKSGSYKGKSNVLGHGGRAQQLEDRGVPGGVIGNIARAKKAAPGQPNFHGSKRGR